MAATEAYEADAYLRNADLILWRLFSTSYDLADLTDATYWCEELNSRFPNEQRGVECRLWQMTMHESETDIDLAWELADAYVAMSGPQTVELDRRWAGMAVAAVIARAGRVDSARVVARRSRGNADIDPIGPGLRRGVRPYAPRRQREGARSADGVHGGRRPGSVGDRLLVVRRARGRTAVSNAGGVGVAGLRGGSSEPPRLVFVEPLTIRTPRIFLLGNFEKDANGQIFSHLDPAVKPISRQFAGVTPDDLSGFAFFKGCSQIYARIGLDSSDDARGSGAGAIERADEEFANGDLTTHRMGAHVLRNSQRQRLTGLRVARIHRREVAERSFRVRRVPCPRNT